MMGKRLKEIFGLILINITLVSGSLNAETVYADTQAKIEIEKTEMPLKICVDEENKKTVLQIVAAWKKIYKNNGVEFKNVFVVGLEENLFPSGMAGDSPRALEEERRLFYVAITRAEEHCYLSFAKTRFRYGKMEFGSPSRFLRDIDVHYLQLPHEAGVSRSVDEGAGRFRREI